MAVLWLLKRNQSWDSKWPLVRKFSWNWHAVNFTQAPCNHKSVCGEREIAINLSSRASSIATEIALIRAFTGRGYRVNNTPRVAIKNCATHLLSQKARVSCQQLINNSRICPIVTKTLFTASDSEHGVRRRSCFPGLHSFKLGLSLVTVIILLLACLLVGVVCKQRSYKIRRHPRVTKSAPYADRVLDLCILNMLYSRCSVLNTF